MKLRTLLLPACALTGAALLLAPREATGYSTNGGILGLSQRDVRVYDSFADATANDNVTAHVSFPGYLGAEMALWKCTVEWSSELHGAGTGDPHQSTSLGSGGANFDPSWQGNALGVGGTNDNIMSPLHADGGGVYAYCELPVSDGWRIRFYETPWTWADGPSATIPAGQVDLQGIGTHEYGHSLGLGHSTAGGSPTMVAGTPPPAVAQRSISADDIAGVQAVYGVKLGTKPRITSVNVIGTQVTINGTNFSATNNEVWFTQKNQGGTGTPIKVTAVTSGGTSITVTVPTNAGKGDVLVRNNGTTHSNLSNPFPIDVTGTGGGTAPDITGLNPSTVDAVTPDPETVVVTGNNFTGITSITLGGVSLAGSYTVVSSNTINITLPLWTTLGDLPLVITNTSGFDTTTLGIAACQPPVVDLANSEPFFTLNPLGITITTGSEPGDIVFVDAAPDNLPSVLPGLIDFGIGNFFTTLVQLQTVVVPAKGWVQFASGPLTVPAGSHIYVQAAAFPNDSGGTDLVEVSNVQHTIVFL